MKTVDPSISPFKIGDFVRISKHREAFQKSYSSNWSNKIFQIEKIRSTNPRTLLLMTFI